MAVDAALRVLYVTPEVAPWVKTGGLGEVAQGLPPALAAAGAQVRLLVPAYPALRAAFPQARVVADFPAPGGALPPARLLEAPGAPPLWLLDCPPLFERAGNPYQTPQREDWPDNDLRFGLLSRVAALLAGDASPLDWRPDVVHCNDWQSGLAPAYLAHAPGARAATVMTIHNLAYQGLFPRGSLEPLALPASSFVPDGLEFYGKLSFLKAGLHYADLVTTVSPGYAREIQTPELGFGLDGLLRARAADLVGILNGIDTELWDPARDPLIAQRYDVDWLERKAPNKAALQRAFGLPETAGAPLLGMASRLVPQKGADLVLAVADDLVRSRRAAGHPRHRRARDRKRADRARGAPSAPRGGAHRLRRAARAPDRGRRRHVPHALALRALRAEPALQHALRNAARGAAHRRTGRLGQRADRIPVRRADAAGAARRARACARGLAQAERLARAAAQRHAARLRLGRFRRAPTSRPTAARSAAARPLPPARAAPRAAPPCSRWSGRGPRSKPRSAARCA